MSNHQSPRWSARITVIGLCALLGAGLLALGGGSSAADAAGATSQPSPYADKIGVITRGFWYSVEDGRAVYDRLVASGVTITREDSSWAHTEPTRGRFDWSRGDNMFTAASRSGIDILPILGYAAPWAALDPGNNQSMPSYIGAYANFSAAVVARYGRGGTFWAQHPELSPRPARTVEVFNEPFDEYYNFVSGGFSGQMSVYGLPSGRLFRVIPVFSVDPEKGWGYSEETKPMLNTSHGFVPWDDLHHVELSQTSGEINGKWVFGNANNTPRLARIDLKTFKTAEIIELPNSAGNHSSPFGTENFEYIVAGTRFSVPADYSDGDVPIDTYKTEF